MVDTVDLIFHYGGKWEYNLELYYVDGETEIVENFDVDFLSFTHMMKKYCIDLKFLNVSKLYALKPGHRLHDGLYLLVDDQSILKMVEYNRNKFGLHEVHIYGHHEVDVPLVNDEVSLIEDGNNINEN